MKRNSWVFTLSVALSVPAGVLAEEAPDASGDAAAVQEESGGAEPAMPAEGTAAPAEATTADPAEAAADSSPATSETDAAGNGEGGEETAEEVRFDDRSFREKYFSFGFSDTWHPQVQESKVVYIILSIVAGNFLPFPDIWLPLVMWEQKPDVDWSVLLKNYLIKYAIQVGGHVVLMIPFPCYYTPCGIFLVGGHVAWSVLNRWTHLVMMLNMYDDFLKHPKDKDKDKEKDKDAAPAKEMEDAVN